MFVGFFCIKCKKYPLVPPEFIDWRFRQKKTENLMKFLDF